MTLPQGKAESGAHILQRLKGAMGSALVEIILGVDNRAINKWIKGDSTPNTETAKVIALLGYVWDTLTGSLASKDAKIWLVSHSDYLYGVPATEMRGRPEDVYLAALNRVSRGEDIDRLHARLVSPHESHESQTDGTEGP